MLTMIKATLQPSEAMTVLDNRMRQIGRLNTEIADWLQVSRCASSFEYNTIDHETGAQKSRGAILGRTEETRQASGYTGSS